jgi:hypothetical protein
MGICLLIEGGSLTLPVQSISSFSIKADPKLQIIDCFPHHFLFYLGLFIKFYEAIAMFNDLR